MLNLNFIFKNILYKTDKFLGFQLIIFRVSQRKIHCKNFIQYIILKNWTF